MKAVSSTKLKKCWICDKLIEDEKDKVRDHCHFTGKYCGAAHKKCNLQSRKLKFTQDCDISYFSQL